MVRTVSALAMAAGILVAAATGATAASEARQGQWEMRPIGNKLAIPVYREMPFALTGTVDTTPARDGDCEPQWRSIGNKLTVPARTC